jgi:hypothetical protein
MAFSNAVTESVLGDGGENKETFYQSRNYNPVITRMGIKS